LMQKVLKNFLHQRPVITDRSERNLFEESGKDSSGSQGFVLLLGCARVGIYIDGFGKTP